MDVAQRISVLIEREHAELRNAIVEAGEALTELEAGKRPWTDPERGKATTQPTAYRHGERPAPTKHSSTHEPAPKRSSRTTVPLRQVWDVFVPKLEAHLKRKRELLFPLMQKTLRGDPKTRSGTKMMIQQIAAEHEPLREALIGVRREARSVGPVRNEMERVARLFEAHLRIEETEVYPAVLGYGEVPGSLSDQITQPGHTGTPLPPDARSATDVGRQLRGRPVEKPPQPTEPEGMLGRFRSLFKR